MDFATQTDLQEILKTLPKIGETFTDYCETTFKVTGYCVGDSDNRLNTQNCTYFNWSLGKTQILLKQQLEDIGIITEIV